MKIKIFFVVIILIELNSYTFGQTNFRSGVFLHHSTGQIIWGSVPEAITSYNTANGLTGSDAVSMTQDWFPTYNNDWVDWHQIFDNKLAADIYPYFINNKIIAIKSCFPSSAMEGIGSYLDTIQDPWRKTIYNYKWHWRSIIKIMEQYPDHFFSIWTNVPLVKGATTAQAALWSFQFSTWAKDTLAAGLDVEYGAFPPNVFVFNYFPILVDENNFLDPKYATSDSDSHPNSAAAAIIAPLWINELFDAAIAYEKTISSVVETNINNMSTYKLDQNYPNPFNPGTKIGFSIQKGSNVKILVYNSIGEKIATILDAYKEAGHHEVYFDSSYLPSRMKALSSGIYFYKISTPEFSAVKKMILLK